MSFSHATVYLKKNRTFAALPLTRTMHQDIIPYYRQLQEKHTLRHAQLSRRHNIITASRLLVAIAFIAALYFYFANAYTPALYGALAALVVFIPLMQLNRKTAWDKHFHKNLIRINKEEIDFLEHKQSTAAPGTQYQDSNHAYAADLDLFGPRSLYQHLNRTGTQMGQDQLAALLLQPQQATQIGAAQEAVQELRDAIDWRQELLAIARITDDNRDVYRYLVQWSQTKEPGLPRFLMALAWILPAALLLCLALYFIVKDNLYWEIATKLAPINLVLIATQMKQVKQALANTDKTDEILRQYAAMIARIEQASFKSAAMLQLQRDLKATQEQASKQIGKLSAIYRRMETIQNPFGAFILNGLFLYHLHALNSLRQWKERYARQIPIWLEVIGTVEALSSLANFSYNNPAFTFPVLNDRQEVAFSALGHPLIDEEKRITNDISFIDHNFVILTGSNMSGKSTFLRTLGINIVLAGMGAPVCASKASLHPMPVLVSMRQTDSLADSESYFFAEVKRLKFIIDQLGQETCFVLLDEILRGTNSDDKRSGTIGVIEKMIHRKVIGAIATHDLEVCLTTDAHPDKLSNKCFEVEIINNELVFDYQLREGICKNKSAAFLMRKMEII